MRLAVNFQNLGLYVLFLLYDFSFQTNLKTIFILRICRYFIGTFCFQESVSVSTKYYDIFMHALYGPLFEIN